MVFGVRKKIKLESRYSKESDLGIGKDFKRISCNEDTSSKTGKASEINEFSHREVSGSLEGIERSD